MNGTRRLVGVLVIAALFAVNGVAAVVTSVPPLGPALPALVVALNVAYGLALLYVAYGLFRLRPWAWIATVAIQAIQAVFAVVGLVRTPREPVFWVVLAVAAAIVLYMSRPKVRAAFGRLPARA